MDLTIQASDISRKMENEAGRALSLIKEKEDEVNEILKKIKSAATKVGLAVAKNAAHYRDAKQRW